MLLALKNNAGCRGPVKTELLKGVGLLRLTLIPTHITLTTFIHSNSQKTFVKPVDVVAVSVFTISATAYKLLSVNLNTSSSSELIIHCKKKKDKTKNKQNDNNNNKNRTKLRRSYAYFYVTTIL